MTDAVARLTAALADRYRMERKLGEGGTATVYLAHDLRHHREVAIKVLKPQLAAVLGRERFLKEIEVTAGLQHPHILPLFDSGEADGFLFYVMPYVAGETLKSKLSREEQLGTDEGVTIAKAVAAALHYAHRRGVIHRDVKPENVLLSDGLPVVADFGIARAVQTAGSDRLTETGFSLGTPAYMSPEQASGDREVDARSDVYSLGCLLYEMVTGAPPFTGATARATIVKIFTEPTPSARDLRGTVPESVDLVIQRALAKEPADRFASAAEFAAALAGGSAVPVRVKEALAIAPAQRTPFVARAEERAALLVALDDAERGQGSLMLVGGEPGVGKTRLAEEILLEAQRRELLCFIGHCYEGEGKAPYTPWVETLEYAARAIPEDPFREALGDAAPEVARILPQLRKVFPDIPPAIELPPEEQRRYLFNSYREFVERGALISPMVCLLEDLHWADEPSLLLLEHLAQHIPTQRTLIIGTYRDVELDVTRPFAKVLGNLTRQRLAQRITLRRLSDGSTHELLAALGGRGEPPPQLVQMIFHETEGNPFFVEEVFRHLAEEGRLFDGEGRWLKNLDVRQLDVPEGVRLVVGRRLQRVGADVQKALTAGAVVGRNFGLRTLEALELLGGDGLYDALEAAEGAQLVHAATAGRDTVYRFSHELVRQTLLGALSIPRRQRLHLRIAHAMEQIYPTQLQDRAADYSYHLYQAGAAVEETKAIRYLTIAADQALEGVAFEEALVHIERALSIEEEPEPAQHAGLLQRAGTALLGLGRWRDAAERWEAAVPLFETLGDTETVAQLCTLISNLRLWHGHAEEARVITERALQAVGEEPTAARRRLLAMSGAVEAMSDDPVRAEHGLLAVGDAVRSAIPLDDPGLLGFCESWHAITLHNHGRFQDLVGPGEAAAAAFRATDQRWELLQMLGHLEWGHVLAGRVEDALALHDEVRMRADEIGHVGARLLDDYSFGVWEFMRTGDIHRWMDFFRGGQESWKPAGPWWIGAAMFVTFGAFLQGDWEAAADELEAQAREYVGHWWTGWGAGLAFLVRAYAGTGDPLAIFQEFEHTLPRPGGDAVVGAKCLAVLAIEGLAVLGERELAAKLYPVARDAVDGGTVVLGGTALGPRCLGIAAACGGQWDVAEEHFETTLALAHALPFRVEQPQARHWYAWMLLDRNRPGDTEKAATLLREAIEMYAEIGMPKHVELAEGLLVAAGL